MGSRILAFLLASSAALAADGAYVGAAVCSGCHAEQANLHQASGHARSLARPGDHPLAARLKAPASMVRDGRFRFDIAAAGDRLVVAVRDPDGDADPVRIVADWAFGAGDQAVTLVSRLDEDWYLEHHWSYYSAPGAWATTPGHQETQAGDLGQAIGVRYRTFSPGAEILRCFRCHSTGPLALGDAMEIEPHELGVRCESCHGPGSAHVAAVSEGRADDVKASIENPGRLSPPALIERCGACHRPPASDPREIDYSDPWNVRHQPVYLARSRCFRASETLTCMTCHDPHGRVRLHGAADYRRICLDCHSDAASKPAAACGEAAQADCAGCHMPKVRPHEHLAFTNHWIGVFGAADPLIPRRDSR